MYKNILVPVLFDHDHDTQASFAAARALADDDAVFTIVHVLEEIPGYVSAEISKEILARTREETEKSLSATAENLPGAKTMLLTGHTGRSIVDYAAAKGVDCIIIASHKPGLENLLIGSTASRVVRHAKCAVHVIR